MCDTAPVCSIDSRPCPVAPLPSPPPPPPSPFSVYELYGDDVPKRRMPLPSQAPSLLPFPPSCPPLSVYELYGDYVLKNPFYEIEMPIRCELFDYHLGVTILGAARA